MYKGFWIEGNAGNNAFSFDQRKKLLGRPPHLWVSPLLSGTIADVQIGNQVGFEEIDEHGNLQSVTGLKNFVVMEINSESKKIPLYIFDNHNHSFFFWHQTLKSGTISEKAKLVHIDAHTDLNEPQSYFPKEERNNMEKVFEYTNTILNVGNFILPAIHTGCIDSEIIMINTENILLESNPEKFSVAPNQSLILDLDLDFWNSDLVNMETEKGIAYTRRWLQRANMVTVATSPFFMPQTRALEVLQKILSEENGTT